MILSMLQRNMIPLLSFDFLEQKLVKHQFVDFPQIPLQMPLNIGPSAESPVKGFIQTALQF